MNWKKREGLFFLNPFFFCFSSKEWTKWTLEHLYIVFLWHLLWPRQPRKAGVEWASTRLSQSTLLVLLHISFTFFSDVSFQPVKSHDLRVYETQTPVHALIQHKYFPIPIFPSHLKIFFHFSKEISEYEEHWPLSLVVQVRQFWPQ